MNHHDLEQWPGWVLHGRGHVDEIDDGEPLGPGTRLHHYVLGDAGELVDVPADQVGDRTVYPGTL